MITPQIFRSPSKAGEDMGDKPVAFGAGAGGVKLTETAQGAERRGCRTTLAVALFGTSRSSARCALWHFALFGTSRPLALRALIAAAVS
jgi:hypothetical protein